MFEELASSIRDYFRERISSPILSTFTINWALWNYKFITVLFYPEHYTKRFNYIDSQLYKDGFLHVLSSTVLKPELTTIIFLVTYPILSKLVYSYWRQKQKELKEIREKIEGDTLLTKQESQKILKRLFQLEQEYENDLSVRDQKIQFLNELLAKKNAGPVNETEETNNPTAPTEIDDISGILQETKERIILDIAEYERRDVKAKETDLIDDISSKWLIDRVEAKLALDELINSDFLSRNYLPKTGYVVSLQSKGRKKGLELRKKNKID